MEREASRERAGNSSPTLAIIIVSWNTRELLRACLRSLEDERVRGDVQIWVVDNASADGTPEMVEEEFPDVRLLRNRENRGFARANNQVLRRTRASHVLLLNPDTEVGGDAVERAWNAARRHRTVVAARLLNSDGSLQHSCFRFPSLAVDLLEALYLHFLLPRRLRAPLLLGGHWDHDEEREVDWALGAFLLVPTAAIDVAGPLSEDFSLFGEDLEWCWRLRRAGYPVRYLPDVQVIHHGNQSAGQLPPAWRIRRTHETKYLFCREHYGAARTLLHRAVDLLGYSIRSVLFTVLGIGSRRRRVQGARYRRIARVLLLGEGKEANA